MEEHELTRLLAAVREGHSEAKEELWSLLYAELRALARTQMANRGHGPTRQPTSLAHEAYLKLTRGGSLPGTDGQELLAAAARVMRDIQVDDARRRSRLKRGGDRKRETLDESTSVSDRDPAEVLALDEALRRLEQMDGRKGEVVTLRSFGGLTLAETAHALGVSVRTVASEWRFARAWLRRELRQDDTGAG